MLKISFNFDETTQKVTNLKVESTNSTNTASTKPFDLEVEENKICLTSNAINKLGAVAGDRLSINYWTVDNETTYPIISKSDVFTDGADGQKLTKKGTFSFKGQQRTSLLKFGTLFEFTEFQDKNGEVKDNVFVLTPVKDERLVDSDSNFNTEKQIVAELDSERVEDEIDAILKEENYNDALPF
jgi:hypothetical protein